MKTITAVIAVAVLSAGVLLADGAQAADVSKTREQVRAELVQARANGEIPAYSSDVTDAYIAAHQPAAKSEVAVAKTRAQVLAELREARADGSLDAMNLDASPAPVLPRTRLAAKASKEVNAE